MAITETIPPTMVSIPLAAASFIDPHVFDAVVAGFAAFASVTAFSSAFAACLSWLAGEDSSNVANAAAVGLAYGFFFGLVVAVVAYRDALTAHFT